uniref:Vesicle transport protein GOT1B n=1 Tax=Solanum lycopersicum TaxID=4081 RepID=A0A3Q7I9B0_SOLLC
MTYELDEQKKVGLGLIGFGIFFTFLAIMLFFDRGLLALANILLLAGVALLLGLRSTLQLFKVNYKNEMKTVMGTISFMLGLFLIFVRWPVVGIIVEIYGCIILFGCFWPSIKVFLFQIPVFGWILQYPALKKKKNELKSHIFILFSQARYWLPCNPNIIMMIERLSGL